MSLFIVCIFGFAFSFIRTDFPLQFALHLTKEEKKNPIFIIMDPLYRAPSSHFQFLFFFLHFQLTLHLTKV